MWLICDLQLYPGPLICFEEVISSMLPEPINILCVNNWIIFTQRFDSSLDLFWVIAANSNFGLGLENLNLLTSSATYRLRFILQIWNTGEWFYADYDTIIVAAETDKYRWHFGNYSGNAGDGLRYNPTKWNINDMMFTTRDSENDKQPSCNCECTYESWWYNDCYYATITAQYGTMNGVPSVNPLHSAAIANSRPVWWWSRNFTLMSAIMSRSRIQYVSKYKNVFLHR